jgi:hypothetical protein
LGREKDQDTPRQQSRRTIRQPGVHDIINRSLPNARESIDIDDIESDVEEIDAS